ncbi:TlpA family protein disulfide reductase [Epilithonimonas hungarica]|uniref:Thiol-disulfide isomerase or thioredoxin n=1 Tax=Epilithonimonas hungarica TaxID=454006 RepID=A0A1G7VL41_9FLAO|nr:TlpA disulfide reductase family protein [Epilithonimonas hungarica]SDG60397.1 Thiol-disulfide isomerase or thioredoxin [Epilithonimonas hungarica]
MKKKLLTIFGILLVTLFIIYNVGIDIGSLHLGKRTDDIEVNNQYDIRSSDFYKQFLSTDQLVVVNLWATWCQPCVEEMPMFLELQKEFPDVRFATLSIDKDSGKLKDFLMKNKSLPDVTLQNAAYRKAIRNFLENRSEKSLIYTEIVPITYFIKSGKVVKKIEGSMDKKKITSIIGSLK